MSIGVATGAGTVENEFSAMHQPPKLPYKNLDDELPLIDLLCDFIY